MKTLLAIASVFIIFHFIGCNDNSKSNNNKPVPAGESGTEKLITDYIEIKNALAGDDGKKAALAADRMVSTIRHINASTFNPEQKRIYDDVKDDIKSHAQHIASNEYVIEHQREHFDLLSQDLIDLVKSVGTSKTLYKDFCPMYNNKKGAFWLSETKEIQNPYYGNKMPKCGEVKEEIKAL